MFRDCTYDEGIIALHSYDSGLILFRYQVRQRHNDLQRVRDQITFPFPLPNYLIFIDSFVNNRKCCCCFCCWCCKICLDLINSSSPHNFPSLSSSTVCSEFCLQGPFAFPRSPERLAALFIQAQFLTDLVSPAQFGYTRCCWGRNFVGEQCFRCSEANRNSFVLKSIGV